MTKELSLADLVCEKNKLNNEIYSLKLKIKELKSNSKKELENELKNYKKQLKNKNKELFKKETEELKKLIKLREYNLKQISSKIDINLEEMILNNTKETIADDNYGWEYKHLSKM